MRAANEIIALCFMMAIGVYARKKNFIDDRVEKGLNSILVNIALPLSIINSFYMTYDKTIVDNCKILIVYSIIIHVMAFIISKLVFSKTEKKRGQVLVFMSTFSNCAFMGYPVLASIYGEIGIFYASIFNIFFYIFVWTFGYGVFSAGLTVKESVKNIVRNAALWAVLVGGIIFATQITIPDFLMLGIKSMAALTTPISMIIIGSMLCSSNFMEVIKDKSLYLISFIRLILVPIVVYLPMKYMGMDPMIIAIPTLIMAMPGAAIGPVMAIDNDGDGKYASQCVFITTVLSILTIPLFVALVG